MNKNATTHLPVSLHESFDIGKCTFSHENSSAVYSPLNSEVLLCERAVLEFLIQLDSNPESAAHLLCTTYPEKYDDILDQLQQMNIISFHE